MANNNAPMVGWIGMGRMGFPMAERLLKAGYKVSIWNRTREKAEPLAAQGAKIVGKLSELSEVDVLFSMVSTLRPYGRAIFLRSRLAEADFGIPAAVGVHSIGIDIAAIAEPEAEIASRLEKFAENAHRSGLRCHVHGLSTSSLSLAAVSSGFDYLAGDAIAPCADAPWGVQPFDAESLFLRRLATADA